ncbi:MAG: tetratricopeptide repeat protein [Armatimonadota bacterium]|nr:MAG: tetratricopeptide repeat protein [Armatimonadota bacterium]
MTAVSRCRACGAFVQKEDRFCWSCGSELGVAAEAPQPRPTELPTEVDSEAELMVRRAHLAQQRGDLEKAERLLQEVVARAPDNVPALSMLSEVLRARGDLVGAVAAAQRATELAGAGSRTPGAVARAREARAQIEDRVVREMRSQAGPGAGDPLSVLRSPGDKWYRSQHFYFALGTLGLVSLYLALAALLRGRFVGYVWFAVSFSAAGWCYNDAETRRAGGLLWGPFVLFLGPFGLAIYLLARY